MEYIKMPYVYCNCCRTYIACKISMNEKNDKSLVSCNCGKTKLDPSTTPYKVIGNPEDYYDHSGLFYDSLASSDNLIEKYGLYEGYAKVKNELFSLKRQYPEEFAKIFCEENSPNEFISEYITISDGYFSTVKDRYFLLKSVSAYIEDSLITNAMNQQGWHYTSIPGEDNRWEREEDYFENYNKGFLVTYSHSQHYSTPEERDSAAEFMAGENFLCVYVDNTEKDSESNYFSMDVFEESYSSNRVVGGVYKVYAKDTEKDISEDVALRMVANIYLSEGLPMYFEYDGVKHILTITYLMRVGEEKWTDCSVHL